MAAVPADLSISPRWILPMTSPVEVLEDHTLVVRDGRILDILPTSMAAERYTAAIHLDRPGHLLMPGLVNGRVRVSGTGPSARRYDGALLSMAEMLRGGTTCFCGGPFPHDLARAAADIGMRALIGIPIGADDDLTRALSLRDEYRGHSRVTTAFAPQALVGISDDTFMRLATLANELDASIMMVVHESLGEIEESMTRHGRRPLERMHALGLLTPAMTAAHMDYVNPADRELLERSGVAITLCLQSSLRSGCGVPPIGSWSRTGLRLSVGSGTHPAMTSLDLWSELRLLTLLSPDAGGAGALSAWDVLAIGTRGGAACLGLDADIGTLQLNRWADLCCVDMQHPAMHRAVGSLAEQLVFNGGRDSVSDVWVAGRQLLDSGVLTQVDWSELAARTALRDLDTHALSLS